MTRDYKPRRKNKVDENGKPRQKRSDAGKPRGKRPFKKKEVNDEGTNDNDNSDETTEISVVDEDITVESSDSNDDISIIDDETIDSNGKAVSKQPVTKASKLSNLIECKETVKDDDAHDDKNHEISTDINPKSLLRKPRKVENNTRRKRSDTIIISSNINRNKILSKMYIKS